MPPTRVASLLLVLLPLQAQESSRGRSVYPPMPAGSPAPLAVDGAGAETEDAMAPYTERIGGTEVSFALVPIRGGRFTIGSPETEPERGGEEGPQQEVQVSPFWMGRTEVTWDEYHVFMLRLDLELRKRGAAEAAPQDAWADAVTRPTPPYVPMDFKMGTKGMPAISMTQFAAKQYTKWLSMKTGRFYRLPTEAEWEYACRAGTTSAYSFGDDPAALGEHAWFFGNSDDAYHPVATKKPNPWGLYDMHGNVAEWVLDGFERRAYAAFGAGAVDPITWPKDLYPRVVRGGSFDDDPGELRSAARRGSSKTWMIRDPQLPKSIWYLTDAKFVGFRVVRPLSPPPPEERARCWDADVESIRKIEEEQRRGGR